MLQSQEVEQQLLELEVWQRTNTASESTIQLEPGRLMVSPMAAQEHRLLRTNLAHMVQVAMLGVPAL